MDPMVWGGSGHFETGVVYHQNRSPWPDLEVVVDALFNGNSHDPHDLEDWLAILRETVGLEWALRPVESWRHDGLNLNPSLSQRASRTRLSLPDQLDYTLLEHFRKLQQPGDVISGANGGTQGHVPVERMTREPSRPLQRHSVGEIRWMPPHNHPQLATSPQQFFKNIWTDQEPNGPNWPVPSSHLQQPPLAHAHCSMPRGPRSRPRPRRIYSFFCAFCFKNKESLQMVTSHNLYYPRSSIVSCPVLRNYVCRWCGATGDVAHTDSYCPLKKGRGTSKGKQQPSADAKPRNGTTKKQVASSNWYQENFPPLPSKPN